LTRDDITAAAFRAVERDELDALTMRGLARELGVTAMALYAHVENKDEILDEIIDRVLRDVGVADVDDGGDWKAWMVETTERLQRVLVRYPALLDRYCRRPVGVPAALERMEAVLDVLRRAGFDDRRCIAAYATIQTYTLGFAALETARQRGLRQVPARAVVELTEASPFYWPTLFASLPASEYPNLVRLSPDLTSFTTDAQFHDGLLAILDGLESERSLEQS
jgi:AcrR family transcriptional regulator